MKVPDLRLNMTTAFLKALSISNIGILAENCGLAITNIANPVALIISIRLPGLPLEAHLSGSKSDITLIEEIVKDFGITSAAKDRKILNSIILTTSDDREIAITLIKHLGSSIGYIAALSDGTGDNYMPISEAVWLCGAQIGNRIGSLLAPGSPASDEILGRRILAELSSSGVSGISVISSPGDKQDVSLILKNDKVVFKKIEKIPARKLSGIDDGEIIDEDLMALLWPGVESAAGIWMMIGPENFLAVGLNDKKLINSQTISRIRDAMEKAVIRDSEFLAKSFERLKADFKKMVKSERAAAITETAVTINHEINNPLTAILGNTQLLLMTKDKLPAEIVAKLETIERSAIKIRETTSKLMAIIEPVTAPYASGLEMIDIEKSKKKKNH